MAAPEAEAEVEAEVEVAKQVDAAGPRLEVIDPKVAVGVACGSA